MATIVTTELEIYKGTTVVVGNRVQQKTEQGSPAVISIGNASMGGDDCLMPGSQYSVRARCTNSENYTSDWTALYPFKSLISIGWAERPGTGLPDVDLTQVNGEWRLTVSNYTVYSDGSEDGSTAGVIAYDSNAMSLDAVYVYVGTTNNITSAVRLTTDAQGIGQGYYVNNAMLSQAGAQFTFQENSTYYVWLGVTDDAQTASRTYNTTSASVTSGYAAPTISLTNPTHTYNSIGATVNVTSSETISSITATLTPTGGGTTYTKNLSTSSPQTVTFTDGDTDAGGNPVVINPSTEYRLTVTVATPSHPSTTTSTNITTDSQAVSTIAVNSVSNISPSGAAVNLVYGSGS